MHILEALVNLYAPHLCAGCQAEGSVLCGRCRHRLPPPESRCYRCHETTRDGRTCGRCQQYGLAAVWPASRYTGTAKGLVWSLKFGRTRAAAAVMADRMADVCAPYAGQNMVVVVAPTAMARVRTRGYDQASLLARRLAAGLGLDYAPLLRRAGRQKQVGASRAQRQAQLHQAFSVAGAARLRGRHVLLVDDVVTTGATLESAANALRQAGAASVQAAVFAQA